MTIRRIRPVSEKQPRQRGSRRGFRDKTAFPDRLENGFEALNRPEKAGDDLLQMLSDKLQKETGQTSKMAKSPSVPNQSRSAGTVWGRPFGPFDACYRGRISASKETPIPGIPISGFSDRAHLIAVSRFSEKPTYFSCFTIGNHIG